jgi:pimeloyl-ACP methyl ester carboxylesterase
MSEQLKPIMRSLSDMSGGNRRAATISAACSGATPLPEPGPTPKEFRRCTRRGCRSATTATYPREALGLRRVRRRFWALLFLTWIFKLSITAQTLSLPARSPSALTGSQLATNATLLSPDLPIRESFIEKEILSGNLPNFLRQLCPVNLINVNVGQTNAATIYVTPDYLALGSDDDYLLMPMTPATAQRLADVAGCILPTRQMVDVIYASAAVKLSPQPMPPGPTMTTVPVFAQHNDIVRTQRVADVKSHPLGTLVAGNKKDVVLTTRLINAPTKVAIYGWHRTNGVAIQPLYLGHTAAWVDYSHGIRLVSQTMLLNGRPTNIAEILADPNLCHLLSDEGVITQPRYPTNQASANQRTATGPRSQRAATQQAIESGLNATDSRSAADGDRPRSDRLRWPQGFIASKHFGELTRELNLPDGVRVVINAPGEIRAPLTPSDGERVAEGRVRGYPTAKPLLLVFFALPNGNTIEQTIGKQMQPGDDWHFNIQHIGAQTRFLRSVLTNQTIVVAYLENSLKSWPAWRRTNGNDRIPALFNAVRDIFADYRQEIVLTGHSGGGSLTFGYLNAVPEIPRDIKRIAFLDSNYAYETTNHFAKLVGWLKQTTDDTREIPRTRPSGHPLPIGWGEGRGEGSVPYLCVLAYHDSIALLDGKTFVSERGGTWGRSHAMLEDLRREFPFTSSTNSAGLQSHVAANGRIQLLLKKNPEKKILHTVQVDRNGFIHALLTGTQLENRGYEYFGERAYERWIQRD